MFAGLIWSEEHQEWVGQQEKIKSEIQMEKDYIHFIRWKIKSTYKHQYINQYIQQNLLGRFLRIRFWVRATAEKDENKWFWKKRWEEESPESYTNWGEGRQSHRLSTRPLVRKGQDWITSKLKLRLEKSSILKKQIINSCNVILLLRCFSEAKYVPQLYRWAHDRF